MKIKKNRFSIRPAAAALIGLLAMASCGHDDRLASESSGAPAPGERVPLGITTSLDAELTPNAQATTKAAVTSGSMGVYMYPNTIHNREYTYTAGAWTATGSPILLGGENASVLAVYPRTTPSSTNGDKVMFPVFQAYSAANDIRYASSGTPASVSNVSPDVSLTLKHLYSRIKMKVDLSSGDTGSGTLNSITLEFYNKPSGATDVNAKLSYAGVQISDGSLFTATSSATTSYSQTISKTLTGGTPNEDFDMLCSSFTGWLLGGGAAATTAITAVVITVKFDNVNYRTSIPASTFLAGGLQAGKQYTVTLKLQRGVTVTAESVTVEDWGTTSDIGSEDIYGEESDYYVVTGGTDPVTIGGIKWARSNLVQTGSGVNAPVSLAGTPLDAGSHWNWGMRDAALYGASDFLTGTGSWESPDPGDHQDPCRALGQGWRLPTNADFTLLLNKYVPKDTKVKIGGKEGTITGYTGWCPELKCVVIKDGYQLLALPITGYRGNDSFVVVNDDGYYWVSDAMGTDKAGSLSVFSSGIFVSNLGSDRNYGQCIRCVQEN